MSKISALSVWLRLAASPAFATLALWTIAFGDREAAMICAAGQGGPISGMALMYLLMAAFHLPCWLRLAARRNGLRARRNPPPSGGGVGAADGGGRAL